MKRTVGRAVLAFKGPKIGFDVGAARDIYGLRNRVCKERGLWKTSAFAKTPKSASLQVRDHTPMQIIGLYFGSYDTESGYRAVNVICEARDIVDDLVDTPSRDYVGNGRNNVAR